MSFNLKQDEEIVIAKRGSFTKKIVVGLGWDPLNVDEKKRLLFKKRHIDCDVSALMLDAKTGKLKDIKDVVYFRGLTHKTQSVFHIGDNKNGYGENDDEQLVIDLFKVPPIYNKILFVANIYEAKSRHQHFGMMANSYIRLFEKDSNVEICRYNLSNDYDGFTSLVFGELYLDEFDWKFKAHSIGTMDDGLKEIVARYI